MTNKTNNWTTALMTGSQQVRPAQTICFPLHHKGPLDFPPGGANTREEV